MTTTYIITFYAILVIILAVSAYAGFRIGLFFRKKSK